MILSSAIIASLYYLNIGRPAVDYLSIIIGLIIFCTTLTIAFIAKYNVIVKLINIFLYSFTFLILPVNVWMFFYGL